MTDLTTIIDGLAASVDPFMGMLSGFCYFMGINLMWVAVKKINKIGDFTARGGPGTPTFIPVAYLVGGLIFIYLPSFLDVAHNTFFGASSSAISYVDLEAKYGPNATSIMKIVNLAGLVWFLRGISLLVQASEQGVQHGPKGMLFMISGIFALNIQYTEKVVAYTMAFITKASL